MAGRAHLLTISSSQGPPYHCWSVIWVSWQLEGAASHSSMTLSRQLKCPSRQLKCPPTSLQTILWKASASLSLADSVGCWLELISWWPLIANDQIGSWLLLISPAACHTAFQRASPCHAQTISRGHDYKQHVHLGTWLLRNSASSIHWLSTE